MDSRGTSVLVNKKCTTERECQRSKVGCVEIDTQMVGERARWLFLMFISDFVADVRFLLRSELLQC